MERGLKRAISLFQLSNPEESTEKKWDAYTEARLQTAKKSLAVLNVPKKDSDSTSVSSDNDDFDDFDSESDEGVIVDVTKEAVQNLAKPLGVKKRALLDAIHILHCSAEFDDMTPQSVTVLSRIYSLSTPCSVDVHFRYYSRSRYYEVEWFYAIGYKINTRPAQVSSDHDEVLAGTSSDVSTMHSDHRWNSIAWGLYENLGDNYGRHWKRIVHKGSGLSKQGVQEVCEALFGALPDPKALSASGKSAMKKQKQENREKLVLAVRLLIASVGVKYDIAMREGEKDVNAGVHGSIEWDLNGWGNWFPREVRHACGLVLSRDPEEEAKDKKSYEEELERKDDEEGCSDDEEGYSDDEEGCSDDEEWCSNVQMNYFD